MQFRKCLCISLISPTIFLLIISPILLDAFAQSTADQHTRISISLDKNSYNLGDSIVVTVSIYASEDERKRNQPILISLYAPTGPYYSQEIIPENTSASETKFVSHTFKLSSDAPTGRWSAAASYLDAKAETIFSVSSSPPPYTIKISSDKSLYKVGDIANLNVVVEPVSNEPVLVTVIGPPQVAYLSEKLFTDSLGSAQLSFSIAQGYPLGTWEARAEYRGSKSSVFFRVEANLSIQPLPKISLLTSPASMKIGEEVSIEIRVSDDYLTPILLQYSSDQNHWNVITKVTPTNGSAKTSWIPDVAGKIYLRGYFEGNDRYKSTVSNTAAIMIEKTDVIVPKHLSISINILQHEIYLGDRVSVYADTGGVSKTVFIQFSTDKARWINIMDTHTPGTVTWIPEKLGEFYVRAFFAGDVEYAESVSNIVNVIVKQRSVAQTVDVFTQLGGKGVLNMNGGVFSHGERLIIYALVQGNEPVEGTVVTVNMMVMSKTAEIIAVMHNQVVAGANGIATVAVDTSSLEPNIYLVTASLDKSPDTHDKLQFQIVAPKPSDIIPTDKITPKLQLTLSQTSIEFGESVTGNVKADPPMLDSIMIQSSNDEREWRDVMKISLSTGSARFSWVAESVGTFYLRAYYSGNADYKASYSEPSTIEVAVQRPTILLEKRAFSLEEEVRITVSYLANTALNLSVAYPEGPAVDRIIHTDDTGQATFSLQLEPDGMLGVYIITVTDLNKDRESSVTFFVDKPTREPELKEIFVRGELLLGFREDLDVKSVDVQRIVRQAGGEVVNVIEETNTIKIRVPEGAEDAITQDLLETDTIKFGSTNKYLVPTSFFEDEELSSALVESYEMVDIPDLWPHTARSKMVAVIDSGIDIDHEELKESVWLNDDNCNNGVDDDSNGFVDDCNGWNFVTSNNDVNDEGEIPPGCDSHGTHIAGTIDSIGNLWRSDLAPGVAIMPLKVSGNMKMEGKIVCVSTEEKVLEAVIYAVNNGAKIINLSLGCPNQEKCDMPALGETFRYANENGVLVVVPAGNEKGIDDWQDYSQYVLEISSVSSGEEHADYSNTGPGVELAAPGTHVYSTKIGGGYGTKTGTSHSAAMVSGCASVLLSSNELLTNTDIEDILKESSKDLGEIGRDDSFGHGLLDCDDALKQVVWLDYELASISLQLWNSPFHDITLELALPRALIDSRTGHGLAGIDAEFVVFADDKLVGYEETASTERERMLRVFVPAGAKSVEILGTVATPEFGVIAVLLLAVTFTVGTLMNKRYLRLTN